MNYPLIFAVPISIDHIHDPPVPLFSKPQVLQRCKGGHLLDSTTSGAKRSAWDWKWRCGGMVKCRKSWGDPLFPTIMGICPLIIHH